MNADETRLLAGFTAEMKALKCSGMRVHLVLDPEQAWAVLSHVQLALRHPQNNGPTAVLARGVVREIVEQIAPEGSACRHVYERGERGE